MQTIKALQQLYSKYSKHSAYQQMPSELASIVPVNGVRQKSRHDIERLSFIRSIVDPANKRILDIGANTGFFTFELLKFGAREVMCYEGNSDHAKFIRLAAELTNVTERITIVNDFYNFTIHPELGRFDVALLLNVLHHLGDDFGDVNIGMAEAKRLMIENLIRMADVAEYLVFQIGFCWKGNRDLLLFQNGSKREMIDFISTGVGDVWRIAEIGIPERIGENIVYRRPDGNNTRRDDALGEFLNRPIFILSRKG